MKHVKKFETNSAYEASLNTLALPNVSLVSEEYEVYYKPYIPQINHDYVEIAGIKWATMNLGAQSITDIGLYYSWGDTQGYSIEQIGLGDSKHLFIEENSKYFKEDVGWAEYNKYNAEDEKINLEQIDDAVYAAWGGNWRMPTQDEFSLLLEATIVNWETNYQGSNIDGILLTSKEDSSKQLFFPNSGYFCTYTDEESINGYRNIENTNDDPATTNTHQYVEVWSSNVGDDCGNQDAHVLEFTYFINDDDISTGIGTNLRQAGVVIRGILDE